jgi:pimeloyl-ACP methyl ester carboxylesterase
MGEGARLRRRSCLIIALLIALLAGCAAADEAVAPTATSAPSPTATAVPTATLIPTREFEPADCQFYTGGDTTIECGYLIVPEDRSQPDGRTIRLHVAILRSVGAALRPDPLLHLSGGPGGPTLDDLGTLRAMYQGVLVQRDVVLFDQRGVGHSQPSLDCPEYEEAQREILAGNLDPEQEETMVLEALRACRDRLVAEGVDLSMYHSAAIAADVHELMQALGYERYNLYGISYGTRLALTVMRDHPANVRSAVLDSVVPLEVNLYEGFGPSAGRALDLLFERCAADEDCSTRFPDLEASFYALVDRLADEPLSVAAQGTTYLVDGGDLVYLILMSMYHADEIPHLPKAITDIAAGRKGWLSRRMADVSSGRFISEGMFHSVTCREEIPFNRREVVVDTAEAAIHPAILRAMEKELNGYEFGTCELWDVVAADAIETEPVVSDIPTLILSGDYDPVTPPAFGQAAADNLANVWHYVFSGVGHGVVRSRRCAQEIMVQFLEEPREEPDTSCLADLRFGFVTR